MIFQVLGLFEDSSSPLISTSLGFNSRHVMHRPQPLVFVSLSM